MRCFTLRRSRRARLVAVCGIAGILAFPIATAAPAAAQPENCAPRGVDLPAGIPWHLQRMQPESVWALTRGADVTVAVIDSGVSATHPMLQGKVREGRDLGGLPDHAGRCDLDGHGTLAAGVIAGRDGVEGLALTGIAPDARILPVRVVPDAETSIGSEESVIVADAIRWAVDNEADIINLSLTSDSTNELAEAVAYAVDHDVVVVAAVGNCEVEDGQQTGCQPPYPAAYPGVIGVGGVDEAGGHSNSSSETAAVKVAAPGQGIWGPMPGGGFGARDGTSFATPIVSGVAALVRDRYPELTAEQVADQIIQTADDPPEGWNLQVGYGVVNPYRAVTATLGTRPNVPADALALPPPQPDHLASARRTAAWAALAAVVVAGLLLLTPPAVRRGRERRWRPARMP